MNLFQYRTLASIVRTVLEDHGGRVSKEDLVKSVKRTMSVSEWEEWANAALRRDIFGAEKNKRHSNIGDEVFTAPNGDIAQLKFFTEEELEPLARKVARLSVAHRDKVFQLAEYAQQTYGRCRFDPEQIMSEAS